MHQGLLEVVPVVDSSPDASSWKIGLVAVGGLGPFVAKDHHLVVPDLGCDRRPEQSDRIAQLLRPLGIVGLVEREETGRIVAAAVMMLRHDTDQTLWMQC